MKNEIKGTILVFSLVGIIFSLYILNNKILNNELSKSVETYSLLVEELADVKIIAHRGGMVYAPENTLPAYEIAGKLGFWGAECDATCTKDGHWVVMHDAKVDRTTNGKGKISELTLKQIKKLIIDEGANISLYPKLRVPTLQEYIEVCKIYNMVPIIEIKESMKNDYKTFVELLKQENISDKCIVISFSTKELMNIAKLDKSIKLQLLINHTITQKDIDMVRKIGNCDLDIKEPTKEGIKLAQDNNVLVNCYLINSIDRARDVIHMGVDYFTTDWINRIN